MEIDADLRRKTAVSAAAVGISLVTFTAIGLAFSEEIPNGGIAFSNTGGFAVVAALVGFIFLMAGIGVWLDNTTADTAETDDADPTE
ncbi:MAG: hypothetical protein J07HN6_00655 [Halonotius sp. J07HN6]|jgi:hypothetical protein|nr:MAG: hypothetical protein J07HN6_00655 [Halonotius sp. J07HN6]